MSTTDEELSQLQAEVEAKRARLADTQAARDEFAQSSLNDSHKAALEAESARLDKLLVDAEASLEHEIAQATSNSEKAHELMLAAVAAQEESQGRANGAATAKAARAAAAQALADAQAAAEAQAEADAQAAADAAATDQSQGV